MVSVTAIAGIAAPVRPAASIAREISAGGDERPRRVVDQNDVGLLRGERFKPGMHRGLARRAAMVGGAWRSPLTASLKIAASSGFTTGCTANTCGWRQNGSIAR